MATNERAAPGAAEAEAGPWAAEAAAVPPPPDAAADEAAELRDRLLRTLAEMENLRQRTRREVEEARKFGVAGLARGLLEVADNLARALASAPRERRGGDRLLDDLAEGVEMTERGLLALLERHEIRKVEPARGERFDPALHQAMFEVPTAGLPAGAVAEVLQPGYVIADRLLRPAMVGVAKAAPAGVPDGAAGAALDTLA